MKKFIKRFLLIIVILIVLVVSYVFIIRKLDNKVADEKIVYTIPSGSPTLLPTKFIDGARFYIKLYTIEGDTLLAFGDSGGGISLIPREIVKKLGLENKMSTALIKGVMPVKYIAVKDLLVNHEILAPTLPNHLILRTFFARVTEPLFLIPPDDEEVKFLTEQMNLDIFLGQNFFMNKSFTIDYPNEQLWANTPLEQFEDSSMQHIGFKKNKHGQNYFGHASMYIVVGTDTIEVLFDTGATFVLSEKGKNYFNTKESTKAGSFIAASIFDKWRKEHPEWNYYEAADLSGDVIEVPIVNIGGYEVGPVLFAKRPDEAWSEGMIHTMDKVVKGAIGGSALQYLKVTIDYNNALIKFEK